MKEFKEFALRGNVMDMAIGVIIGAGFQSIVASLSEDIISPIIGLLVQVDFKDWVISMGSVNLAIGSFITAVLNFIILAFCLFLIVKAANKMTKKPEEAPAPAPEKSDELKTLERIAELLEEKK